MPSDLSDAPHVDLLADDFAARFPAVHASALGPELLELEAEARAWFDPPDDEIRNDLARLERVLATSSLLEPSRPDTLNLALVRTVARVPAVWDDAHVFAGVALAALSTAASELDDEAYSLRYLGAGRDALRLAELVDAPHKAAGDLAAARDAKAFETLQDVVTAWKARDAMPWKQKVPAVAELVGISAKHVERLHAEAVRLGMLD